MNQITDIKNSDEAAFLEVYNQFHVKLFHYFQKRVRSQESARDLTQQTFIKLWQYRHTLSEEHTMDTQCFNIANSVLVDHLRKQAVERKHQDHFQQQNSDHSLYISHSSKEFESADYLNVVAEHLPPVRKSIFLLKIAKGYSNKEIADQLSISIKTVEDHYSKAMRHVKSMVSLTVAALLSLF